MLSNTIQTYLILIRLNFVKRAHFLHHRSTFTWSELARKFFQVNQRKIEIIDNVFITKLLESDDVNGEEQAEREVKGAIVIDIGKKIPYQGNCYQEWYVRND
jgi:hypothetical protein